jgi:hypothetical protein
MERNLGLERHEGHRAPPEPSYDVPYAGHLQTGDGDELDRFLVEVIETAPRAQD